MVEDQFGGVYGEGVEGWKTVFGDGDGVSFFL